MVKDVQLVITPKLVIDVTFVDDVHDDIVSLVVVESNFVDPPLSFNVLLGFVSHSNVPISSFMDLSIYMALMMIFLCVHLIHPYHMYLI